jgi:hypothetical protein
VLLRYTHEELVSEDWRVGAIRTGAARTAREQSTARFGAVAHRGGLGSCCGGHPRGIEHGWNEVGMTDAQDGGTPTEALDVEMLNDLDEREFYCER